jgi:hypothetical protein
VVVEIHIDSYGQRIIVCSDVTVHMQLLQVSLNRDSSGSYLQYHLETHVCSYSFRVHEIQS